MESNWISTKNTPGWCMPRTKQSKLLATQFATTKFGRTLLHEAGARDMPSVASALLTRNVPAHSLDPDGVTPLHEACGAASDKVAKLLIDRGAALDNQITSVLLRVYVHF